MLNTAPASDEKAQNRTIDEYIFNVKLYAMLFASLCLIGTTTSFIFNLDKIVLGPKSTVASIKTYSSTLNLCQSLAALVTGLISYFARNKINEYVFLILAAVVAGVGFLLAMFAVWFLDTLMFFAAVCIGIASGMGWMMPAMIAYDDAGAQPFGVLFSFILVANYWGMCTFTFIFRMLWMNLKSSWIPNLIIFLIGAIGSLISSVVALTMDEKV